MTSQSFGKARRVRRRGEYQRAFQGGIRVHGRYFTLVLAPNANGPIRLGIVASRKVGDAVTRNRAKRLIRDIFRRNSQASAGAGIDVVVMPRPGLFEAAYPLLEADFRDVLRRGVSRMRGRSAGAVMR